MYRIYSCCTKGDFILEAMLDVIIFSVFAYLLGSVSFGSILAQMFGIGDLRSRGSKNTGATNVLRLGGRYLGAMTLILDAAKGAIPVLLARYYSMGSSEIACLAFFVVFGHIFPLWYKFRGGKGIATTVGVLLAVDWRLGCLFMVIWMIGFFTSGLASLSSISAILVTLICSYWVFSFPIALGYTLISVIVCYKHKGNIARILKKKEQRLRL